VKRTKQLCRTVEAEPTRVYPSDSASRIHASESPVRSTSLFELVELEKRTVRVRELLVRIVNDRFVDLAKEHGFYSEELMADLRDRTTIQNVEAIPDDVKPLFHTAHDVPADGHFRIQTAFQEHVDNAVSKTENLPRSASVEDVTDIFLTARKLEVKGLTTSRA